MVAAPADFDGGCRLIWGTGRRLQAISLRDMGVEEVSSQESEWRRLLLAYCTVM